MPSIELRRSLRRPAIGLASACAIIATVAAAQAQDGRGFFDMLFGAPQQAAPAPQADPASGFYGYGASRQGRHHRRSESARQRPKTRYAALPKAEVDPDKILGKQPVDQKAILDNPTKAILEDKTLRPGDIVVLPAGPKVFRGGSDKRHRPSDFEDVKQSRLIDGKTRQLLLAMMVPVGALPADQARKVMAAKRRLAHPSEIAAVEARHEAKPGVAGEADGEGQPLRVIIPWRETP